MEFLKEMLSRGYLCEAKLIQTFEELNLSNEDLASLTGAIISLKPPKFISKEFFLVNLSTILNNNLNDNLKKSLQSLQNFDEIKKKEEQVTEPFKGKDLEIIEEPKAIIKKIIVDDFVKYFRARFNFLKRILQERTLENLTSINKISGQRRNISIIGLVSDRRVSKNKNIILTIEDMTGSMAVMIKIDKEDLVKKANEIVLDEVIAVTGSGNSEILFANDIFFPEIVMREKKKSKEEIYALFTADLHIGSDKFLEENFLKFIEWVNGNIGSEKQKDIAKKVKYLFIVGDNIDGVGVYPRQEAELAIKDVREQYALLAKYLSKIRGDVTIFLCPGGKHDSVCQIEPQPKIPKEVAPGLYEIKNLILTTNPSLLKIARSQGFPGFNVLIYHGDSYDYYMDSVEPLRLSNAKLKPDMISHLLLRKRHLAPSHTSTTYFPSEEDPLMIKSAPDILVTGHIHKSAVSQYNGILTVCCSCWQSKTTYQEKFGHEPDPCKVPILNLQTGKINILDFS